MNQICQAGHQGMGSQFLPSCRIIVDQAVINALCAQISISREESMCWVDASFEVVAGDAYEAIGRPCLDTPQSGWAVFSSMVHSLNVASSST